MPSSIRILIVDDHSMLREGLLAVLRGESDFEIVGSYDTGATALAALQTDLPDVALVDLRLPEMDGISVLIAIKRKLPTCRVLMLSSQDGDDAVVRALKAGAAGYILKRQPIGELISAIRASLLGKVPLTPDLSVRLLTRFDSQPLTSRETDILRLIANGLSNKRIGDELGITHNTVKNHIVNLMEKLGAADRTQAVTIALQRGIINFD